MPRLNEIIGVIIIGVLLFLGERFDMFVEYVKANPPLPPQVIVKEPEKKLNNAVLVLTIQTPQGAQFKMIEGYDSIKDCALAGGTTQTKWYGGVPDNMKAGYTCITGPDATREKK